jgi:UDP-3-O-[3-hydroxymyristoyl] glucosamine N-acyltransferase
MINKNKICYSIKEIAKKLNRKYTGNSNCYVSGFSDIENAGTEHMVFAIDRPALEKALLSKAPVILGPEKDIALISAGNNTGSGRAFILSDNPYADYARSVKFFFSPDLCTEYKRNKKIKNSTDISSAAFIHDDADIGDNVKIMPGSVIGPGVVVKSNTIIYPNCTVMDGSVIGKDCIIYPNVTLREKVILGNSVIIQSGSVIGGDGFGFAPEGRGYIKIPQIGGVVIGDDVEIGCNVTIDRGAIRNTIIGRGTKIDNLVHIAHNCEIGQDCIIVAMAGVSGSVKIGDHCTLAGQTGVVGHVNIGADTIVAARGVVTSDIAGNIMVSGFPARPHQREKRIKASLNRLPEIVRYVQKLMNLEKKSTD